MILEMLAMVAGGTIGMVLGLELIILINRIGDKLERRK